MKRNWVGVFFVGLALTFSGAVQAAQNLRGHYFAVLFGYQGIGNRATDSHTFASFINGNDVENGSETLPTISWLPATAVVRPVVIETGRNFSLSETMEIAKRNGYEVKAWGPFEITPQLYRMAINRIQVLNSGYYRYQMIPSLLPRQINCVKAVSGLLGQFNPGFQWGFAATTAVVQFFSPFIVNYPSANRDVAERIDLRGMIDSSR